MIHWRGDAFIPNYIDSRPVASNSRRWRFESWPELEPSEVEINFRLIYQGPLPSQSQSKTRAREKHEIRCAFNEQLKYLWGTDPYLTLINQPGFFHHELNRRITERIGDNFNRSGFRFVPLVGKEFGTACALNILFLRRDQPGSLIEGGDLDNRIKTLLDALRIPEGRQEIPDQQASDALLFCLLEDDRLITDLSVTTDRLITPLRETESEKDVHLIIHVRTILIDHTKQPSFWT
jgi:hypothetical protein